MVTLFSVHGGWGNWTVSACSKSCGGGIWVKMRACNNPLPEHGGSKCILINGTTGLTESIEEICNRKICPGKRYHYFIQAFDISGVFGHLKGFSVR